jgi:3-phenylpropionate/trans-cinnamate dioxygenase ferredoxin subunit
MTVVKFHPVGRVDDFIDGQPRRFDLEGQAVVVVRLGDGFKALDDTCSHDDYSLAEGEVDADECTIECWKHGSLFDLDTGAAVTLPATRPVQVFAVEVIDGEVHVGVSNHP